MKSRLITLKPCWRRAAIAIGIAVSVCSVLTIRPRAQQATAPSTVRLNQIIEQLEQGKPAFATDHWQLIEMEHGPYLIDQMSKILADLRPPGVTRPRLTPIVRIPLEADEVVKSMVKQVLDQGVMGVIVPHVRTAEQVRRFVQAMRYPPQRGAKYLEPAGVRGWGPTRAVAYWGLSQLDYARKADVWPLNPEGELLAIVMIESREGVNNINDILKVPGLGSVLIGPADLSLSLGVGTPAANGTAPEVEAATATVARACVAHKVVCGTFGSLDVNARLAQGFRLFTRASGDSR